MLRWFAFAVLLLASAVSAPAQTPAGSIEPKPNPAQDRINALTGQLQDDAAGLALGESRASVNARVGAILCKTDKKTATSLFQSAISDLVNAQSILDTEAKERPNLVIALSRIALVVRPSILMAIGSCDAAFALESLPRTRSAAALRALAQGSEPSGTISATGNPGKAYARSELELEQRLTVLAATQNPDLAIKMLQESIRKGMSPSTFGLLKKLFEMDPESGANLSGEVMDRLLAGSFSSDASDGASASLAQLILTDYLRVKKPGVKEIKFDDGQIRSLAQKLVNYSMAPDPRFGAQRYAAIIPIAEKLAPGSVAALKRMQKSSQTAGSRRGSDANVRRILESKTQSAMLAEAKALPAETRPMVYQAAAARMAQSGDINGANDLLRTNLSGRALENATNQINAAYANHLIGQGKYSEAERLIDELPESTRRTSLLSLATAAFRKSPDDNKGLALNVLHKVRALMPTRPGDNLELSQFVQLTIAYSVIEPDEAFATFEPLIGQLSELADATAVVQGFQYTSNVRRGEFELGSPGISFGFQLDPSLFRQLANADFDATQKLIDTFGRRELRIVYRLQLAESGLK